MYTLRSIQTTVVNGVNVNFKPFVSGTKDGSTGGVVIPKFKIAPGDSIFLKLFARMDAPADVANQTASFRIQMDGTTIFTRTMSAIPLALTPGAVSVLCALRMGNDGTTLFQEDSGVFGEKDAVTNVVRTDTVIKNNMAEITDFSSLVTPISDLTGGMSFMANFNRALNHVFTVDATLTQVQAAATLTLLGFDIWVFQPTGGNTAGA